MTLAIDDHSSASASSTSCSSSSINDNAQTKVCNAPKIDDDGDGDGDGDGDAYQSQQQTETNEKPNREHQHHHHQQQQQEHATQKKWNWDPQEPHPCTIQRMTYKEFRTLFESFGSLLPPLYHTPLVIRNDPARNVHIRSQTSIENITKAFPSNFKVTLSSSNSFSQHRRHIPLSQYLEEITVLQPETTPDQLSNETWYLFGETYNEEWSNLLSSYELPPCQTCSRDLTALAFGIGNIGSGVQWHTHGPGFAQTLHGRKHWILMPPQQKPTYHPDETSRHWMEYTYTHQFQQTKSSSSSTTTQQQQQQQQQQRLYECTLEEGDMIYFPDQWHHATINLDTYTAFISSFTTEHNMS